MARTDLDSVKDAIETDLTDTQVNAFISDANTWVTDFLGDEGLSTARLTLIEKYLACHYVTLRDPRLRSGEVERVRETYQRDTQVTEYLRQAIAEDPTGIVRAKILNQEEAANVSFRHGGYAEGT